jgi:hypothetical protein
VDSSFKLGGLEIMTKVCKVCGTELKNDTYGEKCEDCWAECKYLPSGSTSLLSKMIEAANESQAIRDAYDKRLKKGRVIR